jgi:hypothetical protein
VFQEIICSDVLVVNIFRILLLSNSRMSLSLLWQSAFDTVELNIYN